MTIYIALGANLSSKAGEPAETLRAALVALRSAGIRVRRQSRFYRSPAWPDPADPEFVNAVAEIEAPLSPVDLMAVLHRIEADFGRRRRVVNAARTLDLDLLDFDGVVASDGSGLILPHPRLHERAFVLLPLAEIAPDWRHPASGKSTSELIAALPNNARALPLDG